MTAVRRRAGGRRVLLAAASAAVLAAAACGGDDGSGGGGGNGGTYTFAFLTPLSGPLAQTGVDMRNGAQVALDEPDRVAHPMVVVGVEADTPGVERLRAVDVGDGHATSSSLQSTRSA